jgi:hypothetical protein
MYFIEKLKWSYLIFKKKKLVIRIGAAKRSAEERIWRILNVDFACRDVHRCGGLYPHTL